MHGIERRVTRSLARCFESPPRARSRAPSPPRASAPPARARATRARAPSRRAAASFAANDDVRAIKLAPYCELLTRSNDAERPLAICVGWFGASLKHVKKYASMYVDANCDAVAIAPPSAAMLVPAAVDAYGDVVLRALARHVRGRARVRRARGVERGVHFRWKFNAQGGERRRDGAHDF